MLIIVKYEMAEYTYDELFKNLDLDFKKMINNISIGYKNIFKKKLSFFQIHIIITK